MRQKVTRQPAIKANERQMRGGRRRRTRDGAATTRKSSWSFFLGGADPLCSWAQMAKHRTYCDDGSASLVMATGGGREGGDPAAFVVVAPPCVVVSAPVVVVIAHPPSPFPYVAKCLSPDLCWLLCWNFSRVCGPKGPQISKTSQDLARPNGAHVRQDVTRPQLASNKKMNTHLP